jgi:hypothetical protein
VFSVLVSLMGWIYGARLWGGFKWQDKHTKFHENLLRYSSNIKVIISIIWETSVLLLVTSARLRLSEVGPCGTGVICFAEDLHTMCYTRMCDTYNWQRPSIFTRDKLVLLWDKMSHKDYYRKDSIERRNSGIGPLGACRQAKLIGGKPQASDDMIYIYQGQTCMGFKKFL